METKPADRITAVPILIIPDNRMTMERHHDTDLILPSRINCHPHQRIFTIFRNHLIVCHRLLAITVMAHIDKMIFVLPEISNPGTFLLFEASLHDRIVLTQRNILIPMHPEHRMNLNILCKHKNPRGFLIDPMQNIRTALWVLRLQIFQSPVERTVAHRITFHRQHSCRLVNGKKSIILIKNQ